MQEINDLFLRKPDLKICSWFFASRPSSLISGLHMLDFCVNVSCQVLQNLMQNFEVRNWIVLCFVIDSDIKILKLLFTPYIVLTAQQELLERHRLLPVRSADSLGVRNRKTELERRIVEVDEAIKVFERPRVFVRLGEWFDFTFVNDHIALIWLIE